MNDLGQVVGEANTLDDGFAVIWKLVPASR
jgi:hypothetical protein